MADSTQSPFSGLRDKCVVITGGGTGIGLGIATAFAEVGSRVVISGRRADVLEEAISSISERTDIQGRACDVSNRTQAEELIRWAENELGRIDVLVNAAGINIRTRTMAEMTPEQWDQVLAVNVTGAFNTMHYTLPAMRERNDGLIINISSVAGKRALTLGGIAYASSKFAMTALGTAAGNEEAKNGIRITNVYPGEVNTPILEQRPEPVSDERKQAMVQPEDIGAMMLSIASLPPRAHVPEIIIKPTVQEYV